VVECIFAFVQIDLVRTGFKDDWFRQFQHISVKLKFGLGVDTDKAEK
jgi:hypothetical protein